MPTEPDDFTAERVSQVQSAADDVLHWAVDMAAFDDARRPAQYVEQARQLVVAKAAVDALLDEAFERRTLFADLPASDGRRDAVRDYLRTTSALIDLSGRLRYLLYDALNDVAYQVAARPLQRRRLIENLIENRSSIGAVVMSPVLFDPLPGSSTRAVAADPPTKFRLLELIAVTGQVDLLGDLVDFLAEPSTTPDLALAAVSTIRRIGLPQDARPQQDATLPVPAVTAAKLHEILLAVSPSDLTAAQAAERRALLGWLKTRADDGLAEDGYRWGTFEARPGDWLLMRNPSPYNRFTDLEPGLFTHVGVITDETDRDGRRRMVVVDLPERGTRMQATNLDVFVQRTLHFVVLRHNDESTARAMADRAREAIDCPTRFDLTFRTSRVDALRGRPLAGQTIHTYCAGLLLLCAQEGGDAREQLFPITERPAGGLTSENLAHLGLSFGRQFVSPTGPLFATRLALVGRRPPMYNPRREIEEAIYDHFAQQLADTRLQLSADLSSSLRMKLAQAAQDNTLLARAMTDAAGLDQNTDLVAAARAAAVIETLDEIATGSSGTFLEAQQAVRTSDEEPETAVSDENQSEQAQEDPNGKSKSDDRTAVMRQLRVAHADLVHAWQNDELSPRSLRIRLVDHYVAEGCQAIDRRFFGAP